jgi:hypothetical protein
LETFILDTLANREHYKGTATLPLHISTCNSQTAQTLIQLLHSTTAEASHPFQKQSSSATLLQMMARVGFVHVVVLATLLSLGTPVALFVDLFSLLFAH